MTECSRERSRIAAAILKEVRTLSPTCPLRPEMGRYYEQERQKRGSRWRQWKCKICGKVFMTEFYLDAHLDRKHEVDETKPCLGDYCDVLDCASYPSLAATPTHGDSPPRPRRRKKRAARFASPCADVQDKYEMLVECGLNVSLNLRCQGGRLVSDGLPVANAHVAKSLSPPIVTLYFVLLVVFYVLVYVHWTTKPEPKKKPGRKAPPPRARPAPRRFHTD